MQKRKKNKKIGYIILFISGLLIFWRYSYFIFVPDFFAKVEAVPKKNLSAGIIGGLFIKSDTISNDNSGGQSMAANPFKEDNSGQVKVERRPDAFNLAKVNTVTSLEHGWKKTFSDYYGTGGIVASNEKYLILQLNRKTDFSFNRYMNVMSGSSGPPPTIYLFYNTSKIHYDDIYILNRKTGETVKRFRFSSILQRAYYNPNDDDFYFRFTNKDIYYRYNPE